MLRLLLLLLLLLMPGVDGVGVGDYFVHVRPTASCILPIKPSSYRGHQEVHQHLTAVERLRFFLLLHIQECGGRTLDYPKAPGLDTKPLGLSFNGFAGNAVSTSTCSSSAESDMRLSTAFRRILNIVNLPGHGLSLSMKNIGMTGHSHHSCSTQRARTP